MKILNLYAGIGGNRKLWGDEHQITAVENNQEIADIYRKLYPNDLLWITDAHDFLKDYLNVNHYDFIWSSPPCQSHSSFRHNINVKFRGTEPVYPDMKLYQEILFLKHNAKCKWVVENVKPYYKPLISPDAVLQRHYFWSNFLHPWLIKDFKTDLIRTSQIPQLQKIHGVDLSEFKLKNKRQVLRNCVNPELGRYILDLA